MGNGWIVTAHQFYLHTTAEDATKEAQRVANITRKPVRVMRVKNHITRIVLPAAAELDHSPCGESPPSKLGYP